MAATLMCHFDWATEMDRLLRERYADAERVIVVCDNLNTHTMGAFYEAFSAAYARELVQRIEFCYTRKHGSWLNISENELSSLTRQCVNGRRFGTVQVLGKETAAWSPLHQKQRAVDWQFTIEDARTKLRARIPILKPDRALGGARPIGDPL